jgi:hypothetical protein
MSHICKRVQSQLVANTRIVDFVHIPCTRNDSVARARYQALVSLKVSDMDSAHLTLLTSFGTIRSSDASGFFFPSFVCVLPGAYGRLFFAFLSVLFFVFFLVRFLMVLFQF